MLLVGFSRSVSNLRSSAVCFALGSILSGINHRTVSRIGWRGYAPVQRGWCVPFLLPPTNENDSVWVRFLRCSPFRLRAAVFVDDISFHYCTGPIPNHNPYPPPDSPN